MKHLSVRLPISRDCTLCQIGPRSIACFCHFLHFPTVKSKVSERVRRESEDSIVLPLVTLRGNERREKGRNKTRETRPLFSALLQSLREPQNWLPFLQNQFALFSFPLPDARWNEDLSFFFPSVHIRIPWLFHGVYNKRHLCEVLRSVWSPGSDAKNA